MTTDRISTLDAAWPPRAGWIARLSSALGRIFHRRTGAAVDDDDGDAPPPATSGAPVGRPRGRGSRPPAQSPTQPFDTAGLLEAAPRPAPRAATAPIAPPPVPARAATSPASRLATAAAELAAGEFDPVDALITTLTTGEDDEPPPAPTGNQLAWVERLEPLIEYELMTRGGTAVTFQSTAAQLADLVALSDDFNAAVRVVSRDPAVAAAVLAAANSADRQRGTQVGDIRTAISRLGLAETRQLGIATATRALYEPAAQGLPAHHLAHARGDLHRAMTSAFVNAALAARMGGRGSDDAFVAGMFHDLGRPLAHRAVIALERRGRVEPLPPDALDVVLARTHAAVGADAMVRWGLPARLADLATFHLDPSPPPSKDGADLQRLALVSTLVLRRVGAPVSLAAARRAVTALGLDRSDLRALAIEIVEMAARVTELFGVSDGATTWGAPVFDD